MESEAEPARPEDDFAAKEERRTATLLEEMKEQGSLVTAELKEIRRALGSLVPIRLGYDGPLVLSDERLDTLALIHTGLGRIETELTSLNEKEDLLAQQLDEFESDVVDGARDLTQTLSEHHVFRSCFERELLKRGLLKRTFGGLTEDQARRIVEAIVEHCESAAVAKRADQTNSSTTSQTLP